MGLQPQEAVFLDDLEENIVAANELGFRGVLFADNAQAIGEIEAHLRRQ